jgi:hypothetical protein
MALKLSRPKEKATHCPGSIFIFGKKKFPVIFDEMK